MGLLDHAIRNAKPREEYLRDRVRQAEERALKNATPGMAIGKRGVYIGVYEPEDRNGQSLGKKYIAFAAPEDLKNAQGEKMFLAYAAAAREVAGLRDWHGHNGLYIPHDTALYDALGKGGYGGEWVMPPIEIWRGKNLGGTEKTPNLFDSQRMGAFADSFTLTRGPHASPANGYWSCSASEKPPDATPFALLGDDARFLIIRPMTKECLWEAGDKALLSCRPVRFELIPERQQPPPGRRQSLLGALARALS